MPVDLAAAAAGPFGGLIASGWHTCALMMRLLAEHYLSAVSGLGFPRGERAPLDPAGPAGRTLMLPTVVEEARGSRSKPDRGIVTTRVELVNQAGDTVLRLLATNLVRLRPHAPEPAVDRGEPE